MIDATARTPLLLVLVLALAAAAPACTEAGDSPFTFEETGDSTSDTGDETGDETSDSGETVGFSCVDFETEVLPIFDEYGCTGSFCHGGDPGSGGLNMLTVDALIAGGSSGAAVVAGDAEGSLIVTRTDNGSMPPGPKALTAEEMDVLRIWIAEGALAVPDEAVCGAADDTGADDTSADDTGTTEPTGLDFEDDVAPVFEDHGCSQSFCHGSAAGSNGFDIRTPESILAGGDNGPGLVPCDPDASFLVEKIEGTQTVGGLMPLGGTLIPAEDAELVRQWISEGAGSTFDGDACP